MKIIFGVLFLFFSTAVTAQNPRAMVFNKELKILIGNWEGKTVYTDPAKNNTQFTLQTRLEVIDLKDSIAFHFTHTWPDGKMTYDTTNVCIYDKMDSLSYDHELYEIVSTGRRGPTSMIVVAEKQGFDNRLVADLRRTLTFGPYNLGILKEARYMENEFFFIRSRSTLVKK